MTRGIEPGELGHAEKDDLMLSLLPLVGQLDAALARITELETATGRVRTAGEEPRQFASLPPSRGAKCDRPTGDKRARKSRPGVGRALEGPNPDRVVDARLEVCTPIAPPFSRPSSRRRQASVRRIEIAADRAGT